MSKCPKYDNVFFVRQEECCLNCYHSEYNEKTREAHCIFPELEAKLNVKLAGEIKEQKKLLESF